MKLFEHSSPVLPDGRYLHWHELRFRPPPKGLTPEEWWFAQKFARQSGKVAIPGFRDQADQFWYCRLHAIDRATHELDRRDAHREMLNAMKDSKSRS